MNGEAGGGESKTKDNQLGRYSNTQVEKNAKMGRVLGRN